MCQPTAHHPTPLSEETIAAEDAHLRELLSAHDHRITGSRLAIYEVMLRANDHICAEHILAALDETHRDLNVNKTTVYRTIELLLELGLISEMRHVASRTQYELTLHGPHGHLLCSRCGRVEDLSLEALNAVQMRLERDHHFHANLLDQALLGVCAVCRAAEEHA